jgi:hypothetical protein
MMVVERSKNKNLYQALDLKTAEMIKLVSVKGLNPDADFLYLGWISTKIPSEAEEAKQISPAIPWLFVKVAPDPPHPAISRGSTCPEGSRKMKSAAWLSSVGSRLISTSVAPSTLERTAQRTI